MPGRHSATWVAAIVATIAAAGACGGSAADDALWPDAVATPGVRIVHDFSRDGGFFSAPFPSEDLRRGDGLVDVSAWPNPEGNEFVTDLLTLLGDADGFGLSSGIFFQLDGEISAAGWPDPVGSIADDAPAFIIDVDATSPERGRRIPVTYTFEADAGPYGAPRLLSLLPIQGIPLRPLTLYAAVVRESAGLTGLDEGLATLLRGEELETLSAAAQARYDQALKGLRELGIDGHEIRGLTVFETADPAAAFAAHLAHARAQPTPEPTSFTLTDTFDDLCVYEAEIAMLTYQHGAPPYTQGADSGGGWRTDAGGTPVPFGTETARIVATIPRTSPPAGGYPTVLFIRTGTGGQRALVDRGVHDDNGTTHDPGSGPAREFAKVGFAGVSIDGPHGGRRNISRQDEQLLIFNIINPTALRDNLRQSALELALAPDILAGIRIDTRDCPGAGSEAGFDLGRLALMGHSMGATIAPLTFAFEPRFGALILSGAGGSWIENVVHKRRPVHIRPLAEIIVGYSGRELRSHDPALTLLQWAGEAADPPLYADLVRDDRRSVLMLQGIVDTYILPPIANATSLSFRLDLAGPALDEAHPDLAALRPLSALLPLTGGRAVSLPARHNQAGRTAVVVQHPEDGVEDGHEVVFQTKGPKRQYRCFLATMGEEAGPLVPSSTGGDHACDGLDGGASGE